MNLFLSRTAAFLALMVFSLAAYSQSGNSQANANDLLNKAQLAVGEVAQAAQAIPKMRAENADAKPFWEAMKQLNLALAKAETGLTLQDDTFHGYLASAHAQVLQAQVAVDMNGVSDAKLNSAMSTLTELVTRLDDNYSKDAVRAKNNEPLTASERQQLDKLMAQNEELVKKLELVERNAAKNNEEMKKGIEKIKKQSAALKKAQRNANALHSARLMSSWIWAWHWWWGPWGIWCPGWIDINIVIWDDWIDVVPYDWDLVDDYVDVADLDLDMLDMSDDTLGAWDNYLQGNDFSLDDTDMGAITSDMDLGWNEVESDLGGQIMDDYSDNFQAAPFERDFEVNTFDDYGMDSFGGGFDDFGGDW